jgi:RNA polymerase sigma-70 factor (ECF subfamily)
MRDANQDLELAKRAADGDESAWRTIYDATCERLFSLLCYQVGNREEALDLMQETYMRAHARLRSYRGEAPLAYWIRRIALSRAFDWKRSALMKLGRTVTIRETTRTIPPEVQHVRFASEEARLQKALSSLTRNQRAVLLLHEWEEHTFQEIAELLHCKPGTVRVHHARAKERMRRALSGHEIANAPAEGLEGQKV